MTKNFQKEYEGEDQVFDPIVACSWLPDKEIRLSEYLNMVTYYVQNYIEKNSYALPLRSQELSNRS